MKRIIIDYADGVYGILETERTCEEDPRIVEVEESTLALWRAIWALESVVQEQLRDLDNKAYAGVSCKGGCDSD